MRNKFIFLLPILFLSLALTSCTSEVGSFLEAINKGLGKTEEVEEESLIPKDYYTKDKQCYTNTYRNLKKFLKSRVELSTYKGGQYDCSEMAARLEHDLQKAGFDAYIAEGLSPSDSSKRHAWVFVRAWRDERLDWFPIEPTDELFYNIEEGVTRSKIFKRIFSLTHRIPGLVTRSNSRYYYGYFKKHDQFWSSIHDIPKSRLQEYDWWNVFD